MVSIISRKVKKIEYHFVMVSSNDIRLNVGTNVRKLRKQKGLSQEKIG